MGSIKEQVAVVTGAGRGIGRAIALMLAEKGARVVMSARSRSELEAAAKAAGGASVFPADVRDRNDVERLLEFASENVGPVDILVNAAGIGIFGKVVDFADEHFSDVMDTNFRGIFFACRYVLPSMIARKNGHIINIASIAGKIGTAERAVYCASKFAVVGFSEALAEEVRGDGVRVSVVCPGSTDTSFSKEARGKSRERMLRPEDVAHVVRMLVTQQSNSFVSEVVMRPLRKP